MSCFLAIVNTEGGNGNEVHVEAQPGAVAAPLRLLLWEVWQVDVDDRCKGVTVVPLPAGSCAYAMRRTGGASASAKCMAASVGGSLADEVKPV